MDGFQADTEGDEEQRTETMIIHVLDVGVRRGHLCPHFENYRCHFERPKNSGRQPSRQQKVKCRDPELSAKRGQNLGNSDQHLLFTVEGSSFGRWGTSKSGGEGNFSQNELKIKK